MRLGARNKQPGAPNGSPFLVPCPLFLVRLRVLVLVLVLLALARPARADGGTLGLFAPSAPFPSTAARVELASRLGSALGAGAG